MGIAKYEIFGTDGTWRVRHDGKAENEYATKEAAFEAAIAAASLALRQGHDVTVTAPSSGTTTGAPAKSVFEPADAKPLVLQPRHGTSAFRCQRPRRQRRQAKDLTHRTE
jgi:hypothetical protein